MLKTLKNIEEVIRDSPNPIPKKEELQDLANKCKRYLPEDRITMKQVVAELEVLLPKTE